MRTLLALAVLSTWPVVAAPWDSVQRLAGGTKIELSTKDGQDRNVEFVSATADSVVVRTRFGEQSIERSEVRSIRQKVPGRRVRRGLLGVAIGAGAGAALGALACVRCENWSPGAAARQLASIGGGFGTLAFSSSDYRIVYSEPQ